MRGLGASFLDTLSQLSGRAGTASQGITQFVQSAPVIQQKAEEAVNIAESWAIASVALQAVAAFSALGMYVIHQKSYNRRYRGGNTVSSNPRRRKRK